MDCNLPPSNSNNQDPTATENPDQITIPAVNNLELFVTSTPSSQHREEEREMQAVAPKKQDAESNAAIVVDKPKTVCKVEEASNGSKLQGFQTIKELTVFWIVSTIAALLGWAATIGYITDFARKDEPYAAEGHILYVFIIAITCTCLSVKHFENKQNVDNHLWNWSAHLVNSLEAWGILSMALNILLKS